MGCRDADATAEACFLDFELEPEPEPLCSVPTECDPFVMAQTTPRIQPPVVVARTSDGTVYAVDRLDHGFDRPGVDGSLVPRLFIAEDQTLVRIAGGTGGSQATEKHLFDSFGAADGSVTGIVRVDRKPGYPENIIPSETAVVIFETPPVGGPNLEDVFGEGTRLDVLPECATESYDVLDLPQSKHIEYVAEDERGHQILVVVPVVDWDVESATLFYGPPGAVLQRPVQSFGRERDGGTTHIRFDFEGAEATLHFWVGCNGAFTHDCEGTLELPDQELTVTIPSRDPALLEGNTYVCHDSVPPGG